MAIHNVSRTIPGLIERVGGSPQNSSSANEPGQPSFGDLLSRTIENVNDLHQESARIQEAFMSGEPVELHQVMIKAEKAGLATDLLLEIRNKLLEAYNNIARMPM